MNAKLLTLLVGAALVLPVAYASHGDDDFSWGKGNVRFGECPDGPASNKPQFDCEGAPNADGSPPDLVTGHTVFASWIMNRSFERDILRNNTLGLPTDFAAIAGYFEFNDNVLIRERLERAVQRECVVWFNGQNLDQRPDADNFGANNSFPSDEDEPIPDDESYQDYDFDRDVPNCEPFFDDPEVRVINEINAAGHGRFAVGVEKGDCNPAFGTDFRFRGHLDFVDPNGIYHEVQEYDYVCPNKVGRNFAHLRPFGVGVPTAQQPLSDAAKAFFPWTYSDEHNEGGCDVHETPLDNGHFDLGHKCNGSVQDLFTDRLWITPVHDPQFDATIEKVYNFALQIDTCAGLNIYEVEGKEAMGDQNDYANSENFPFTVSTFATGQVGAAWALQRYHDVAYHTYYGTGLDEYIGGWPLYDVCTDGSTLSFNDTPRGRVVHGGPPQGTGDEDIMRGNSYDFDQNSDTFGKHRTNCRVQDIDWPLNTYPPGPNPIGADCYPEDHKTAQVDLYVFDHDPTLLWTLHEKGLTGPQGYSGAGQSTGPDGEPQEAPGV